MTVQQSQLSTFSPAHSHCQQLFTFNILSLFGMVTRLSEQHMLCQLGCRKLATKLTTAGSGVQQTLQKSMKLKNMDRYYTPGPNKHGKGRQKFWSMATRTPASNMSSLSWLCIHMMPPS